MTRPREFDTNQVLHNAMLLFWRKGFNKTSVRDLTEATQLNPGSLYGTFENKRTLFLKSLENYSNELKQSVDLILRSNEPPLIRIKKFFEFLIRTTSEDPQSRGCLLINTLLEIPIDDKEIIQQASQGLNYVENSFVDLLQEARQQGELDSNADPAALAKLLLTGIFGMRVYAKMQAAPETLQGIVKTLLSILDREPAVIGSAK
ncbi:MAG: TetR family transcriptional regulator [Gammaproteobacteria bacterium]|nr:TetR family transcriptional regulator [Gammaproteobacteria bacterium]